MEFLVFVQAALPIVGFLVPLVIAMFQLAGRLGVAGKWQLISSMASGLVLGVLALIADLGLPPSFAFWFGYVVVGLVTGLSACGVYEAVKHGLNASCDGSSQH